MAKKNFPQALKTWLNTRPGYAALAVIELLIVYVLASRAIDTGSWWEYGFAFLALIFSIQNLVHLIKGK
jgi:hypothetical protein